MSVLAQPLRRWPLLSFFALTYLVSWWVAPLQVPGFPLFPFGPDLAVLVVVALTVGRTGVRRLLGSLTRWRAAPRWYALVLGLPVLVTLVAVYAMRLWGAPGSAMPAPADFASYLIVLPLAAIIGGPLGEELGFRGYALPLLQQRHPALVAVAVLFVGHAIWHLPLFFTADPPPVGAFLIGLLAGGVVLAWLFNSTGNLVLVILLHAGFNTAQQVFMGGFDGAASAHVQLLVALGWVLAAGVVVWRTRGTLAPRGGSRFATTPLFAVEPPSARPNLYVKHSAFL
jgi:uncharacterized protein